MTKTNARGKISTYYLLHVDCFQYFNYYYSGHNIEMRPEFLKLVRFWNRAELKSEEIKDPRQLSSSKSQDDLDARIEEAIETAKAPRQLQLKTMILI